ncbi:LCP family protein [Leuconostoc pseudomesenteroides]|uniref:LCP family protein n=1 Tax=Leuconostoc pseudomesenteroides TaxID=33968 RepID=UPI001668E256|nr:LCP family protein [Leuconostoc pseudomesenteroides]
MADKATHRMDKYASSKQSHILRKYAILFILLIAITGSILGSVYLHNIQHSVNRSYSSTGLHSEGKVSHLIESKKPISFLVLGTDVGTDGGFGTNRNRVGLTDSMMVVTINPQKKITTLISIPRDIMTSISGFENTFPQKLNAAYAFREASDKNASLGDGVGTAISTLQKMFNFPINYYAMVNMSGLGDVVDQLGGISVNSPLTFAFSQETAHATGKDLYQFYKGSTKFKYAADGESFSTYSKMNGKAALAFSRMRYQDPNGDYGRTERQRILLNAIIKKIKSNPTKILNIKFINTTTKNIASDLSAKDMIALGSNYMSASKNIVSYTVQGEGEMYDGLSYQRVTTAQRQAITNKVRASLNLKSATTGSEFGSDVTQDELDQVGTADELYPDNNTSQNLKLQSENGN